MVVLVLATMVVPGLYCIIQDVRDEFKYYNNYYNV